MISCLAGNILSYHVTKCVLVSGSDSDKCNSIRISPHSSLVSILGLYKLTRRLLKNYGTIAILLKHLNRQHSPHHSFHRLRKTCFMTVNVIIQLFYWVEIHNIKLAILMCAIQWHLVPLEYYATISSL